MNMKKNWTNLIYNKINNIDHNIIQNKGLTNEINTSSDHVLYAEDTAIEFKNIQDIDKKLHAHNEMPQKKTSK